MWQLCVILLRREYDFIVSRVEPWPLVLGTMYVVQRDEDCQILCSPRTDGPSVETAPLAGVL